MLCKIFINYRNKSIASKPTQLIHKDFNIEQNQSPKLMKLESVERNEAVFDLIPSNNVLRAPIQQFKMPDETIKVEERLKNLEYILNSRNNDSDYYPNKKSATTNFEINKAKFIVKKSSQKNSVRKR